MIKVGDVVWVYDYFEDGKRELGEVVRLFENESTSPLVIRGICQHSFAFLYTKFYLDVESLVLTASDFISGMVIHHAHPKNNS